MTEALAQQARDQSLEAWQHAWWDEVPHSQLTRERLRDKSIRWYW